ncbi:MAG: chemotaxis protein CheA [Pseudomonadota bacterium]
MADIEQLKATFFEECDERLAELETELSRISEEGPDNEGLNAIFRTAHSIKAGAAAFKYKDLVEFSHEFEAVLDLLRSNTINADQDMMKLLFEASDVLASLVEAARDGTDFDEQSVNNVLVQLRAVLQGSSSSPPAESTTQDASPENDEPDDASESIYSIQFKPKPELLKYANDPIFIIKELKTLGDLDVQIDISGLPDLEEFDPECCYWSWNLTLSSENKKSDINEVFEFVIDDCELDIQVQKSENQIDEASQVQDQVVVEKEKQPSTSTAKSQAQKKSGKKETKNSPAANKIKSIRVDLQRIDKLVNMVGEIVITQSMLAQMIQQNTDGFNSEVMRGLEDLALHTRELQESVMAVRMQPVGSLFARMPRVVRDLTRRLEKDIQLVMRGEDTEIDKTVIEEVSDPINHLLRNAIDHGIEMPDKRVAAGKSKQGTIELAAEHRGSSIVISIKDDGGGINGEKVLQKAIERGVVEPNAQLTPFEIDNLIFSPGFSTAGQVTDISGRGVGLDVVKKNIENLGGRVSVSSNFGAGTTFTLLLPLTLAVLDGMIVNVGHEKYIIPLTSIVESFRPVKDEIHKLPDDRNVVSIRGEYFSLVYLGHVFDVPNAINDPKKGLVILVETDSMGKIGLVVDDIEGQQQVVIKSLEENYDPVPGISAATILGDGKVALILDIDNLHHSQRSPSHMMNIETSNIPCDVNSTLQAAKLNYSEQTNRITEDAR